MPLTIGQVLENRYRIDALLGQGGMGAVYRATDLRSWHAGRHGDTCTKPSRSDSTGATSQAASARQAPAG